MRQHPHPRMEVPISLAVYQQLLGASTSTGFEKEYWEIAAEAIDEWMRRHDPDAISMPATNGYQWKSLFLPNGYQWKSLFLPNGTLLRTVFGRKNHHCLVENDQILYKGHAVSPSGFVNEVGGIRRNAWRCTWILLPDDKHWKLADALRVRERPLSAHRSAAIVRQAPVTAQSCADCAANPPGAPATRPHASCPPAGRAPASRPPPSHAPASNAPASPSTASHPPADGEPASGAPSASPIHPQAELGAEARADEHNLPPAPEVTFARTQARREDLERQHGTASTRLLPQCRRGADRRTSGKDRITPVLCATPVLFHAPILSDPRLLCDAPLPPLDLARALDGEPPGTRFQPWSSTRRTTLMPFD